MASAGYSGTPLPQKLGIKVAHKIAVIGAPPTFALGVLPAGTTVQRTLAVDRPAQTLIDGLGHTAAQTARARANTRSSIGSVSRPVNVFCWLTWYEPSSCQGPIRTSAAWPNAGFGRGIA